MKKIISLTVVIIIVFSFLAFPFVVSADDEKKMTTQEYYSSQAYLFTQLKDKKIDYPTYSERSKAVTDKYISDNTIIDDIGEHLGNGAKYASDKIGALGQKIGDTIGKYGNAAYDYLSSLGAGLLDGYTVQSQVPSENMPDMKGYGAVVEATLIDTPIHSGGSSDFLYRQFERCDYVVKLGNGIYRLCSSDGKHLIEYYTYFGGNLRSSSISASAVQSENAGRVYKFYGDVRYEDGTQAPTDDTFETITDYDFTQATEKELEDLMKDLLNEFELQMPDLSSIEGLLNAIYARLGTLDSDNDNELLASVNAAVLALVKSNGDNNKALLDELLKFREDLKNGTVGSDSSAHGHEISGTLYNVIPLDKNWLNKIFHDKENLKVQYEGKTYYLEDCGCLKLDDKFYTPNMNYDSYSKFDFDFSSEDDDIEHIVKLSDDNKSIFDIDFGSINDLLPQKNNRMRKSSTFSLNEEKNFLDDIFSHSQVRKIDGAVAILEDFIAIGVPYESIQENFSVYEEIIFNDYLPRDLSFTIFDTEVVLLRYSDFITDVGNETTSYTEPIAIVRSLSSILVGFYWVLSMYKKLSNLI